MKGFLKILKNLFSPGIALVSAGLVVGVLNGWTATAVTLLIVGLVLIVIGLARSTRGGFWQRRSTRAGTNAAVSVLSVLVILALINFLGARYDSRIDLTEGQLLSLSPLSKEVVQNLEQPTEVIVFEQSPNPRDQQLLENYSRIDSAFSYRYIAPFSQPKLEQELGVTGEGEVFVRTGTGEAARSTLVQRMARDPATGIPEPLSERELTNKLAQLNQTEVAVAYFLQGHGEYVIDGSKAGFSEAAVRLADENYTVEPLNLANTGGVPTDADVVIVAGAQQELFDAEVIAIREYLEAGGSLMVLIDPQVKTGLETLMSQWGVVPESTIVIDTSGGGQLVGLGPAAPLVTDYGDHPITESFEDGRSFFPVVRPLQVREVSNVTETPLLYTAQRSHAQPMTEGELAVDPNKAPEGPFTIGVALSRPAEIDVSSLEAPPETEEETESSNQPVEEDAGEDQTEADSASSAADPAEDLPATRSSESRMVVIGSSSFATDGLFSKQLNGDVFLNSVNWLSKVDNPTLSIRPKEQTNRRFNMTVQQMILLTLLALVIFPLLGLIGAGTLWLKRR
ncbi:MAG: Gldg family protein [Phormidesmis sp.]